MSLEILSQASITLISASLSLVGGLALLLTYVKIPDFRTSVHRLLVFLTISDILTAFGYIIGTVNFLTLDDDQRNVTDNMCIAQSFITTFSSLSSFAWTSIIAVHLYLLLRPNRYFDQDRFIQALYFTIGWIIPGDLFLYHCRSVVFKQWHIFFCIHNCILSLPFAYIFAIIFLLFIFNIFYII